MDSNKKKELLKKVIVYTGFFLIFLGALYLIFKPSLRNAEQDGLNTGFPDAEKKELPSKLEDYEQNNLSNGNGISGVVDDISVLADDQALSDTVQSTSATAEEHPAVEELREARRMQAEYENFGMNAKIEQEYREEIARLEEQLQKEKNKPTTSATAQSDTYERMMEKSIEMMNQQMERNRPKPQPSLPAEGPDLEEYQGVKKKRETVTSLSVTSPMVNQFNGIAIGGMKKDNANTIRAIVDKTTTLKPGDYLRLRLMESVHFGDVMLPRGAMVTAKAALDGQRMKLLVTSVENGGKIVAVKLTVFDTDAQEGVNIPTSIEREALKEAGSEVAGNVGQSFTFAQGATDQVISEAARTIMQGGARYMQKKITLPRVTIKSGYEVFLVESK